MRTITLLYSRRAPVWVPTLFAMSMIGGYPSRLSKQMRESNPAPGSEGLCVKQSQLFLAAVVSVMMMLLPLRVDADLTWTNGNVNTTESFADQINVRWDGTSTQDCGDNDVAFNIDSLGSEYAVKRGYAATMVAALTGLPIRFKLDGCIGSLQKAKAVLLCGNEGCSS